MTERFNIAARLRANADLSPGTDAIWFPNGVDAAGEVHFESLSFADVEKDSDAYARGFKRLGITKGTKTIVMVKSSPELYGVLFGLFKVGAVPVVVDPGMGIRKMVECYKSVGAEAFIGIPLAHVVRLLFPDSFTTLRALVTVSKRKLWGGSLLSELHDRGAELVPIADTSHDDLALINFTTGSTGARKGVECTHGMIDAMVRSVEAEFGQCDTDMSLVTIPFIALFNLMIRSTSVLAPMDQAKPGEVDARAVISAINRFRVTMLFGSPAFMHRVTRGAKPGDSFPSLRFVISGGAPVHAKVLDAFRALMPERANFFTTYGATEALPIASIEARETVAETRAATAEGKGTCVGRPRGGTAIRILRISDEALADVTASDWCEPGAIGEITIAGPIVSPRYHRNAEADRLMKIQEGATLWHRTGDLGWLDEKGRLWFVGRKSQRVQTAGGTLFSVATEGIFNGHPLVYRSALVGIGEPGRQQPILCLELNETPDIETRRRVVAEVLRTAQEHPSTRAVTLALVHPKFPVDVRHNAKIGREELAAWASNLVTQARKGPPSLALRSIPIFGWLFIAVGALFYPFFAAHSWLWVLWAIDVFLSVVVHGLQVFVATPRGRAAGHSPSTIAFMTMAYGATWWKDLLPLELEAERANAGRAPTAP